MLKSCDKLTVTMEISRACSKMKPHALVRKLQFKVSPVGMIAATIVEVLEDCVGDLFSTL